MENRQTIDHFGGAQLVAIPTNFGVDVKTPDPIQVQIDVTERTMLMVGFVALLAAAVAIKKFKR
ncbi:hypothetical protein [Vibrio diazotrophicus]|uniref:hypothetical protein n=1 Tax=Vibrio diazotrophicus TaxID=685 RepID=UPI003D2F6B0C